MILEGRTQFGGVVKVRRMQHEQTRGGQTTGPLGGGSRGLWGWWRRQKERWGDSEEWYSGFGSLMKWFTKCTLSIHCSGHWEDINKHNHDPLFSYCFHSRSSANSSCKLQQFTSLLFICLLIYNIWATDNFLSNILRLLGRGWKFHWNQMAVGILHPSVFWELFQSRDPDRSIWQK